MMNKKYINFSKPLFGTEEEKSVNQVLKSGWLTTGLITKKFENKFKKYKKSKYALALNSCTAALHLSLQLLNLKKDDEVITSALTFSSTINSIIITGARPVLADVDITTQNIDPFEIEKKITKKTKAILIVHFAGLACDMDKILFLTKKYNLHLIEDCAHAIEGQFKKKNLGTFGTFGCFSFYATKNLSIGEGGMLITNNKKLVHISTEFVYANNDIPPTETDIPLPDNTWYAHSKLLADNYIKATNVEALICRLLHKPNPFPYEEVWNVKTSGDLVDKIAILVKELITKKATGIFNVGTGDKSLSDLAPYSKIVEPPDHVPKDTRMNIHKLEGFLNV